MKTRIKEILLIALGNLLLAGAVVFFILPNTILSGGTSTLAMALERFIPLSRVALINVLTVGTFFIGLIFLGKKFALKSLLSSILYPVFISLLSLVNSDPFTQIEPLLSALYGGLLMGIGLGLVFREGASTGGMDIPALILNRYLHIPLNKCVFIVDALTILFGASIYGISALSIGLIAVFASSFAINWTQTLGSQSAKNVLIISDKWQEIREYLLHSLDRGVTVLDGYGGYSGKERPVLMCVIHNRRFHIMESEIQNIDPKAFIVVSDVYEVLGSGFTYKDGTL